MNKYCTIIWICSDPIEMRFKYFYVFRIFPTAQRVLNCFSWSEREDEEKKLRKTLTLIEMIEMMIVYVLLVVLYGFLGIVNDTDCVRSLIHAKG